VDNDIGGGRFLECCNTLVSSAPAVAALAHMAHFHMAHVHMAHIWHMFIYCTNPYCTFPYMAHVDIWHICMLSKEHTANITAQVINRRGV